MILALFILAGLVVIQAVMVGHKNHELTFLRWENRVLKASMQWIYDSEDQPTP